MSTCACDYEYPTFHRIEIRKARKEHRCSECGSAIHPMENYEEYTCLSDGRWWRDRVCPDCLEIRGTLQEMPCFCWSYGGLSEDVYYQMKESMFRPGERFGYLRILARHRARRKRRAGRLKQIELEK